MLTFSIICSSKKVDATCLSLDGRINIVGVDSVEYDSALKRKGILTHAAMWMSVKDIMLGETRDQYYMIPFTSDIQVHQIQRPLEPRTGRRRKCGSECLTGYTSTIQRWVVLQVTEHCAFTECHRAAHLKG